MRNRNKYARNYSTVRRVCRAEKTAGNVKSAHKKSSDRTERMKAIFTAFPLGGASIKAMNRRLRWRIPSFRALNPSADRARPAHARVRGSFQCRLQRKKHSGKALETASAKRDNACSRAQCRQSGARDRASANSQAPGAASGVSARPDSTSSTRPSPAIGIT